MNRTPCMHCPDRFPGCHAVCQKEEYLAEEERRKRIRDAKCTEQNRNKRAARRSQ